MKHIRTARTLVLTLALCPWLDATAASPPSPLGMVPARIEYLANDAPFVVFDIAPRSFGGEPTPSGQGHAALTFMATDPLRQVSVAVAARPDRPGAREGAAVRTACGPQIAGYHRCPIPTDVALTHLDRDGGSIGLRVEAEGLDGERSVVLITLPVRAMRAAAPSASPSARLSAVAKRQ
jgi:hypothetical protein